MDNYFVHFQVDYYFVVFVDFVEFVDFAARYIEDNFDLVDFVHIDLMVHFHFVDSD